MAESKEKLIIKDVETKMNELKTAGILKRVIFGSFEPSDGDKPACGIVLDDLDVDREQYSADNQRLPLILRVVVPKDNEAAGYELLDVLYEIDKKLMADKTRGGHAQRTRKTGRHFLFLDPVHPDAGADLRYAIDFSTEIRDPAVQV